MLVSLGIRMRTVRLQTLRPALLAVVLRMAPGLAAAAAWVTLMDLEGAARGVVLLTGVLPSAVMNFVLAEGAGEPSEEVASAILLGTVISVVAIPVVLNLL
jgi:predicted permease